MTDSRLLVVFLAMVGSVACSTPPGERAALVCRNLPPGGNLCLEVRDPNIIESQKSFYTNFDGVTCTPNARCRSRGTVSGCVVANGSVLYDSRATDMARASCMSGEFIPPGQAPPALVFHDTHCLLEESCERYRSALKSSTQETACKAKGGTFKPGVCPQEGATSTCTYDGRLDSIEFVWYGDASPKGTLFCTPGPFSPAPAPSTSGEGSQ